MNRDPHAAARGIANALWISLWIWLAIAYWFREDIAQWLRGEPPPVQTSAPKKDCR
jgi:hypothetical protein